MWMAVKFFVGWELRYGLVAIQEIVLCYWCRLIFFYVCIICRTLALSKWFSLPRQVIYIHTTKIARCFRRLTILLLIHFFSRPETLIYRGFAKICMGNESSPQISKFKKRIQKIWFDYIEGISTQSSGLRGESRFHTVPYFHSVQYIFTFNRPLENFSHSMINPWYALWTIRLW
jgi:hypothetical protein